MSDQQTPAVATDTSLPKRPRFQVLLPQSAQVSPFTMVGDDEYTVAQDVAKMLKPGCYAKRHATNPFEWEVYRHFRGEDWAQGRRFKLVEAIVKPAPLLREDRLKRLLGEVLDAREWVEASSHLHRNQASGVLGALAGALGDAVRGAMPVLDDLDIQQMKGGEAP
ncbi:hypothetical protein [Deinococcus multiflagellatus]|uniref:hypothetical protein n=1 Tax=Deinococcus multiflagellatus TaxID=1656887 RepID=UPI001CCFA433|nr:hypothetical protein [Deinococcus multiflagellatus]MBZ9713781.1 hypothetical protein [Deinococcus multiflagellatus]